MRNPDRIPLVLKEIQTIWEKYPDLRLTQLLLNPFPLKDVHQLYNLEEEELLNGIKRLNEKQKQTRVFGNDD